MGPYNEFGIIDNIKSIKKINEDGCALYEPKKYKCIYISDDIVNVLFEEFKLMKTYFHNLNREELGLDHHGVTIIPPESLAQFQDIIMKTKDFKNTEELVELTEFSILILKAIREKKHIIHYGI
ncbi:MAG: hypothetical protein ACRDA5_05145 [Clostridium sp.]